MITWPASLIRELAERRCVIFLGAGATAGCKANGRSPPTWQAFLEELMGKMRTGGERTIAEPLIAEKRFLDAAEIILADVPAADFTQFIRDQFVTPRFEPSAMHKEVLNIDPKVVLTTNYDDVYDAYCREGDAADGYNVCRYYESHLVSDLRSPIRLIIKAHGCVTDPSKIVLTKSSYFAQKKQYAEFFKILDALFITSTVLFLGYSLSDPDIQLVLENANIVAPRSHPHYAVVPGDTPRALKQSIMTSYNIMFLEFPAGDYEDLTKSLVHLSRLVSEYRELHIA